MPDARGVEGSQPRPSLLRAAAARRPVRKPGESGSVPAPAPAVAPPAPPPARTLDRADRERMDRAEQAEAQ